MILSRINSLCSCRSSTSIYHRIRPFTATARILNDRRPPIWVLTDGGIQSTLSGMAVGKRLGQVELKTVVTSKGI